MYIFNLLKRFWIWFNTPSLYGIWEEAFNRLQIEKKANGRTKEYWRIWHEEVCPAYDKLSKSTPVSLRHPGTNKILEDMNRPVGNRKYY